VKRAFKLSLKGKGGKEIARVFNEEGLRTRSGKLFGTTTINFWLKNPVYTGSLVWNRTDRTSDKPFRKPAAETIVAPDTHTSIVSLADFDRVQALLVDRRPFTRPPRGSIKPLRFERPCLLQQVRRCHDWHSGKIGEVFVL
jgi:site-specific DNA recombinase